MAEISVKDLAYLQDCEKRDEKVAKLVKNYVNFPSHAGDDELMLVDELRKIYSFEDRDKGELNGKTTDQRGT